MARPSTLMGSGCPALLAQAIVGMTANTLTATGTTNADALQLQQAINRVTTTASGTGVILPPLEEGARISVMNSGANALLVYPGTGFQINALTVTTAGFSVAAGGRADFIAFTGGIWGAILSA